MIEFLKVWLPNFILWPVGVYLVASFVVWDFPNVLNHAGLLRAGFVAWVVISVFLTFIQIEQDRRRYLARRFKELCIK